MPIGRVPIGDAGGLCDKLAALPAILSGIDIGNENELLM